MGLINIINELTVSNVNDSINFYKKIFGFAIEDKEGNPITWVKLKKNEKIIMLEEYDEVVKEIKNFPLKKNNSNLIKFEFNSIDDLNNIYEISKKNNLDFFMDYIKTDYGKIEFGIYDIDKNMILLSCEI